MPYISGLEFNSNSSILLEFSDKMDMLKQVFDICLQVEYLFLPISLLVSVGLVETSVFLVSRICQLEFFMSMIALK